MRELILLLVIGGIIGAVVFLRMRRTSRIEGMVAHSLPLLRAYFQRTGYAFAEMRGMPVEAQLQRWEQSFRGVRNGGAGYDVHLVRSFQGVDVHWRHAIRYEYRASIWSQSWWIALPAPPRTLVHITERSNLDPARNKGWQPVFPRQILTGEPQFDQRFAVFGVDEAAARAFVANPTLRAALFPLAYVDLRVLPDQITFSDPRERNTDQILGPTASATMFTNPGHVFQATTPLHDGIASMLIGAASIAR